jgi:hypothetical protein
LNYSTLPTYELVLEFRSRIIFMQFRATTKKSCPLSSLVHPKWRPNLVIERSKIGISKLIYTFIISFYRQPPQKETLIVCFVLGALLSYNVCPKDASSRDALSIGRIVHGRFVHRTHHSGTIRSGTQHQGVYLPWQSSVRCWQCRRCKQPDRWTETQSWWPPPAVCQTKHKWKISKMLKTIIPELYSCHANLKWKAVIPINM